MSQIKFSGNASGTGTLTILAPNTNNDYTLNLPASNGTLVLTGGAQTIEFAAGSAATPSITFTGDTNTGIFSPGADTIAFAEGGVEAMRITSSGEVLVGGTTALTAGTRGTLSLQGTNANPWLNLYRNDTSISSGDYIGSINFWGNDTTSNTPVALASIDARASGTHDSGDNPTDITFSTTPDNSATIAEVVRFTQAGNVGIGTSNPSVRLDATKAGKGTIAGLDTTSFAAGVGGTLDLGGNYRTLGDFQRFVRIAAEKANSTDGDYGYNMGFYVTQNNQATFGLKAMTINSVGDVGIGTASPVGRLNLVQGLSNTVPVFSVGEATGAARFGIYQETSYTGITLSSGNIDLKLKTVNVGGTGGTMSFWTSPNETAIERVRITTAGNVGIGTSSPGSKLSVLGTTSFDGISYVNGRYVALVTFGNVSSVSYDLNNFFALGERAVSVFIQVEYHVSNSSSASSIIHGRRSGNNTWSFATISNVGSYTATGSGSGTTLTVTFNSGNQYGAMSVVMVNGGF